MPLLDDKDLIQVDATAIAGVLILLTLTSITTDNPEIKYTYTVFLGSFIVLSIVPFSISAILILVGNFPASNKPPKPKAYLRIAAGFAIMGFAYLIVIHSVLMSIIFEHYKQLTKLMEQKKAKDKAKSSTLDVWTQTEEGKPQRED